MAKMGKYCKAYSLKRLRAFDGWSENPDGVRKEEVIDGVPTAIDRVLTDDDYLFIQQNYVVTDGIYLEQNIVYDDVTPEWIAFCQQTLGFEVPAFTRAEPDVPAVAPTPPLHKPE